MFRRLFATRIRAAERALANGRLDEAFRTASDPAVADDPRGKKLRIQLADALVDRARQHFREERFAEALIDLNRAEVCRPDNARTEELRGQVQAVAGEVARQEAERRRRIDEARRQVQVGALTAGQRALERVESEDSAAEKLHAEIDERQAQIDGLLQQVDRLRSAERHAEAAVRLDQARRIAPENPLVLAAESRLCDEILENVRRAFASGRLTEARREFELLARTSGRPRERAQWEEQLRLATHAAESIREQDYARARQHIERLRGLSDEITWIRVTLEQLRSAADAVLALQSGPLGAIISQAGAEKAIGAKDCGALAPTRYAPTQPFDTIAPAAGARLPEALLVLVDGGGSYLLVRADRVTIGRAMSSSPALAPVLADISDRHADIVRVDEDYFLFGKGDVQVGGRSGAHHLLRDGVRVVLGRRARFTFQQPDRKSSTAVLAASESTKMPRDVRRVILFSKTAIIGPQRNAHMPCRTSADTLVLFERSDGLWVQPRGPAGRNGDAQAVRLGTPLTIGNISFVVKPWAAESATC